MRVVLNPRICCCFLSLLVVVSAVASRAPAQGRLKVFLLAGQSNMEGQGVVDFDHEKHYNGGKGNLEHVLAQPGNAKRYAHLRGPDGKWTVRDDVWGWFRTQHGLKRGGVTIGFTGYHGKHHMGPELEFAHVVGDHFKEQVLLIKTAWGGKSLYKDFRPPSAGGTVGPYYKRMIAEIREVLGDVKKQFPTYDGSGYEIAGFVWLQGWNDMCTPAAIPEYANNLGCLIDDVRKEFDAPRLPVVVGELGNMGPESRGPMAEFRKAQRAGATQERFKGTVSFVETTAFARPKEGSPCTGHGHHWFANAESYLLIGEALGKAMVRLCPPTDSRDPEPDPEPMFHDATESVGLSIGTDSACWADLDNDGWVDLCVSSGVWKNLAGKRFTRVAEVANPVAADFDNDGLVDLFSWSTRTLYRNAGDMKFVELALPDLPESTSRGACWGDFNGDGFVDLFVGGYEDWGKGITWPFQILINQGGKGFELARSEIGMRARGVTACDYDQDGDLDVYVSNYRLQPNHLWQNDGAATFTDVAARVGVVATSDGFGGGHSIGSAWGDFDSDGLFDLFAGNFAHVDKRGDQPKSRFLKNVGAAAGFSFQDLGTCGVQYQESYATPAAGDFDNDGNLDLFFTTVYGTASFSRKNNPVLFRGNGAFTMTDVTAASGLADLPPTYQAAWADFDNDGALDLVTGGKLFRNRGNGGSWLRVRMRGDGAEVNTAAIGAQVRIGIGDRTYTRQVEAGTGEGNQNDLVLHFGLGSHDEPVELSLLWPNGQREIVKGVALGRTLTLTYDADG